MSATESELTGEFPSDADALSRYARQGEELLSRLPPKRHRSPEQQHTADGIHRSRRLARSRFLELHAERVYAQLTEGKTTHLRLAELSGKAAEELPGLVPTSAQISAERTFIQKEKEGREIDQAIFFRALLREPDVGFHIMDAMLRPTVRAQQLLSQFQSTGRADLGTIGLERSDGVAYLTMRNLSCLNAEDDQSVEDMETAVDLALLDDNVRVGVLRGGPMTHPRYRDQRVFCAGINLRDLHRGKISFVEFLLRREIGYLSKLFHGLLVDDRDTWPYRTVEKPWMAAVDTFAIGGGMQILLVMDQVLADKNSYFSLPAAQEGIIPGVANLRLSRLAGGRLARQIILSGRRIWAHEREAKLFCDQVVEPAAMDTMVLSAAGQLDNPAVLANRSMLNRAEEPADSFREYIAEFSLAQAFRLYSPDVIEKVGRKYESQGSD